MTVSFKRPLVFFTVAVLLLTGVSIIDYETFHFLVDFFSVFIGIMMFVIAINSKVYSEKSIFLVLAVSYLYVSTFDLLHMLTFTGVGFFGESLNHSYQYFATARIYEASVLIIMFLFIRKPERVSYPLSHIFGAVILVVSTLLIHFDLISVYYIDGIGQSGIKLFVSYITAAMFLISAYIVSQSNFNTSQKHLLVTVLIMKALAQLLHASFVEIGDAFQIAAMIVRFISYGGLYIVFIQNTVTDPYKNVYSLFEMKEKELISLSQRDSLTGVYNHSLTFQRIEEAIFKIGKSFDDLCVVLFDVDNFKQINDTYGHIKGDETLMKVTKILENLDIPDKIVGRYGGDEFVLAMPNFSENEVKELFETINQEITKVALETGIKVTFSAGVVVWRMGDNATDLIRKADIKMYQSKEKGKNQYTIWQPEWKE